MAKDEIKKLLDNSKRILQQDYDHFEKTIKDDLANFKKKTLDKV
ncbi:MAG: hypothetical protein ACT4OW_07445 [Nitrososphaerota archaeon]